MSDIVWKRPTEDERRQALRDFDSALFAAWHKVDQHEPETWPRCDSDDPSKICLACLLETVRFYIQSDYCTTCGSCGEPGCCPAKSCTHFRTYCEESSVARQLVEVTDELAHYKEALDKIRAKLSEIG